MTSSCARCSRLSSRMRRSPTNSTASSALATPSASSTLATSRATASSSMSVRVALNTSMRFTSASVGGGGAPRRARHLDLVVVVLVSVDDALDQLVAHHIVPVEGHHGDVFDALQDLGHGDEARGAAVRQVDLRHVAGDDHPAAEAEAREEHLHLLRRRVLRLVEDDERVVERAAAHEGQRRDLDLALLDQGRELLAVHHVVERVEQRPEVGVDLLGHRARAGSPGSRPPPPPDA